jgi:enoyl-CoA hydratase/carnithine racemase
MGLATQVVDDGQALAAALALARQIAAFPQRCMLADRASAMRSGICRWPRPCSAKAPAASR